MPEAAENVAAWPAVTACGIGCAVIAGADWVETTVIETAAVLALTPLLTVNWKLSPPLKPAAGV